MSGAGQGVGAQPPYAIFHPRQLKNGIFRSCFFFDILTIHSDSISYVKHVLDPFYVFFTLFGCLEGGKGLGHNLPMQARQLLDVHGDMRNATPSFSTICLILM